MFKGKREESQADRLTRLKKVTAPEYSEGTVREGIILNAEPSIGDGADDEVIKRYKKAIHGWKHEKDAEELDRFKRERQEVFQQMSDLGLLGSEKLDGLEAYLGADARESLPIEKRSENYASHVRRKAMLRSVYFTDDAGNRKFDAEKYHEMIRDFERVRLNADAQSIDFEYDTLEVRREVVREHFFDAKFIAKVAREDAKFATNGGHHILDEMYRDFAQKDTTSAPAIQRAAKSAGIYKQLSEEVRKRSEQVDGSPADALKAFLRLRGAASEMRLDQTAIVSFAKRFGGEDSSVDNKSAYDFGLYAMDEGSDIRGVLTSIALDASANPAEQQKLLDKISESPSFRFSVARQKFSADLAAGEDVSSSFIFMQRAADDLYQASGDEIPDLAKGGTDDISREDGKADLAAFMIFKREKDISLGLSNEKSLIDEGRELFVDTLDDDMKGSLRTDRKGSEVESTLTDTFGEEVSFKVGASDGVKVTYVDGAHIEITKRNSGFQRSEELLSAFKDDDGSKIDIGSPEMLRDLIGGAHERALDKIDASSGAFSEEKLEDNGVDPELFHKVFDTRESSKSDRFELMIQLGLGEQILRAGGVDEEMFGKIASGEASPQVVLTSLNSLSGDSEDDKNRLFDERYLSRLGVSEDKLQGISELKDDSSGRKAFQRTLETTVLARLDGIVAPPVGTMTGDGKLDAGLESKSHLQEKMEKYGSDATEFFVERAENGMENIVRVKLPDSRDMSEVMVKDGYALPDSENTGTREEKFATRAEKDQKGLWKHIFPQKDEKWRSFRKSPELRAQDKKEKLFDSVAASMAGSALDAYTKLSISEAKLFALPVEDWVDIGKGNVARNVHEAVSNDPMKAKAIYDGNMDILRDLRGRYASKDPKDKLSEEEKLAHDRLSVGRRFLADALIDQGLLTVEEAKEDRHKLLSRKSSVLNEKLAKTAKLAVEKTGEVISEGTKRAGVGARRLMDEAWGMLQ